MLPCWRYNFTNTVGPIDARIASSAIFTDGSKYATPHRHGRRIIINDAFPIAGYAATSAARIASCAIFTDGSKYATPRLH